MTFTDEYLDCQQHVLSVPSLQCIRVYHAHTASISSLSVSPFPPPLAPTKMDAPSRNGSPQKDQAALLTPQSEKERPYARSPKQQPAIPSTPSNAIYIASASIDGNVCVASLNDPKDVILRNFGRPVKAVSLSPDYKNDRSYLSGGLAGNLVLTTGGRAGTSSTSSTTGSTAASASGWLGSLGLGTNTGKDRVLHFGEGTVSTIKWSLSGKYVVWVNEQGIKIMRSHLQLEAAEAEFAWKRISHTDHPNRPGWDEMAGIWKAHVEWIDEAGLESEDTYPPTNAVKKDLENLHDLQRLKSSSPNSRIEKLVVGWSGTIWIMKVHPGGAGTGKNAGEWKWGRAEVVTMYVPQKLADSVTDHLQLAHRLYHIWNFVIYPKFASCTCLRHPWRGSTCKAEVPQKRCASAAKRFAT